MADDRGRWHLQLKAMTTPMCLKGVKVGDSLFIANRVLTGRYPLGQLSGVYDLNRFRNHPAQECPK